MFSGVVIRAIKQSDPGTTVAHPIFISSAARLEPSAASPPHENTMRQLNTKLTFAPFAVTSNAPRGRRTPLFINIFGAD